MATTTAPGADFGTSDLTTEPQTVSVVAPAYNEADNLCGLVSELVDALEPLPHDFEIVIVDDGSTDDTAEKLSHLSALFESVRGVELSRNYGQSTALAAGIEHATGDIIVTIDADGQNDPADIPELLETLESGYDCVSGNRADRQDPLSKRLPSDLQTRLAKATGPDINDFGCTLTAYRAEALDAIQLRGEGHRYIPAQLYDRGFSITEQDVNHRPREHGSSHYGAGRLIRGFVDLVFHVFWNRYGGRPMHLLGGAGFLMLSLGVAIGAASVVQKLVFGVQLAPRTPRLILVALLVLFGVQLIVFGLLSELLVDMRYRDEPTYRIRRVVE